MSTAPVGAKALRPLEGPNQWPEHPPRLRSTLEQWTEKMKVLGMSVMRGMCDGLGLSMEEWEEMRAMVDDSFWVMRVIGAWRGMGLLDLGLGVITSHHITSQHTTAQSSALASLRSISRPGSAAWSEPQPHTSLPNECNPRVSSLTCRQDTLRSRTAWMASRAASTRTTAVSREWAWGVRGA